MKMTYQPKKRSRSKVHGFRARMSSKGGRRVLAARRLKGRKRLSAQATAFVVFLLRIQLQILRKENYMKFSESLKKNSYFQNVYKNGKSYANRFFVMYVLENDLDKNRLGISVSKKVGNSVIRHHVTRLVREAYRLQEERFDCGLDIVVIARVSAKQVSYHETERAILHLGSLHHILKKSII